MRDTMRALARIPGRMYLRGQRAKRKLLQMVMRPLFASHGRGLRFVPEDSRLSYGSIHLGDDVQLNYGAVLIASESSIHIGDKVVMAPNVTIRGGNHNTSVLGRYIKDVRDKRPQDDGRVVVEDDVWIGSNAIILMDVTVGRGSVIAAGAVVNRDVPPYSIVAGVPAQPVKWRFEIDELLAHEAKLYPPEKRLERSFLDQSRAGYPGLPKVEASNLEQFKRELENS